MSMDQCDVRLKDCSVAKLIRKVFQGGLSLGNNQQTRRITVESMNDPGSASFTGRRKLLQMESDSVGERAGRSTGGRMYYKSGRFVYDEERFIFVDNIDRNVLGCKSRGHRQAELNFNFIVGAQFVRRLRGFAVDENIFILNQTLQTCATPVVDLRRKVGVETNTCTTRIKPESEDLL